MTMLAAVIAALLAAAPEGPGKVPEGAWGGEHVRLTLGAQAGEVELDCGRGRFEARGVWIRERGGPTPEDGFPEEKARFSGSYDGTTLKLEVRPAKGGDAIGVFTLEKGRRVRLFKCL